VASINNYKRHDKKNNQSHQGRNISSKVKAPMTLRRFSSRTERLDTEFLAQALQGTSRYLRIAGYFRSSIFELVSEQMP
jgi:hypothetical protein